MRSLSLTERPIASAKHVTFVMEEWGSRWIAFYISQQDTHLFCGYSEWVMSDAGYGHGEKEHGLRVEELFDWDLVELGVLLGVDQLGGVGIDLDGGRDGATAGSP